MTFVFTNHALEEMARRGITREQVEAVLHAPEQQVPEYGDVLCYQSRIDFDGKQYLLRVMVDSHTMKVVTVYRTSKIAKYWSGVL
jgi:hypothetical protein